MSKGWWCFLFAEAEDVSKVLCRFCPIKEGYLFLKRWHRVFLYDKEKLTIGHLWLLMASFPIELWSKSILWVLQIRLAVPFN